MIHHTDIYPVIGRVHGNRHVGTCGSRSQNAAIGYAGNVCEPILTKFQPPMELVAGSKLSEPTLRERLKIKRVGINGGVGHRGPPIRMKGQVGICPAGPIHIGYPPLRNNHGKGLTSPRQGDTTDLNGIGTGRYLRDNDGLRVVDTVKHIIQFRFRIGFKRITTRAPPPLPNHVPDKHIAIRCGHYQVKVVDQGQAGARRSGRVRPGNGDFQ